MPQLSFDIGALLRILAAFIPSLALLHALRQFPVPDIAAAMRLDRDGLRPAYRQLLAREDLLFYAFAPLAVALSYPALRAIHYALTPSAHPSDLLFQSGAMVWTATSTVVGLALAEFCPSYVTRRTLGDRYPEFSHFAAAERGFGVVNVNRWCAVAVTLALPLIVFCTINGDVRVTQSAISIRRPWALRTSIYSYSQVTSISSVRGFRSPDGTIVPRPRFIVRFSDGVDWSTEDLLPSSNPARDQQAASLISARAGKPIVAVESSDRE